MKIGTPVKDVVNGSYGIVSEGKVEWDTFLKWVEEQNVQLDYSDIQVIVYELTEQGYWSHKHINPLHLEVDFPECIPNDEERQALRRAMKSFGDYLIFEDRGRPIEGKSVVKYAKEYADVCRRKNRWRIQVEEAKEVEEIIG